MANSKKESNREAHLDPPSRKSPSPISFVAWKFGNHRFADSEKNGVDSNIGEKVVLVPFKSSSSMEVRPLASLMNLKKIGRASDGGGGRTCFCWALIGPEYGGEFGPAAAAAQVYYNCLQKFFLCGISH